MSYAASLLFVCLGLSTATSPPCLGQEEPRPSPRPKTRVLYIEGAPRWEYRYLKDRLLRDPSVALQCYLASAGEEFLQESSPGSPPLKTLPSTPDALREYDLVILGALPKGFFEERDPDFSTRLAEFIEKDGGGLIALAGEGFRAAPGLSKILPVTLHEEPRSPSAEEPFSLQLTAEGARATFLRLDDDAEENRRIWQNDLPRQHSCPRGVKARAGSEVLVVRPGRSGEEGSVPVIVAARIGKGRSLFIGTDESWRWRAVSSGRWYGRFWSQVIAHVARRRKPRKYFLQEGGPL